MPQTPPEELTALPRPSVWIKGVLFLREEKGEGMQGGKGEQWGRREEGLNGGKRKVCFFGFLGWMPLRSACCNKVFSLGQTDGHRYHDSPLRKTPRWAEICTKFGQLILRKIIKIGLTMQLWYFKANSISARALPQTPYLDLRGLLLRKGKGKDEEGRRGGGGDGKGEATPPPFASAFWVGCGCRHGCAFGVAIIVASIFSIFFRYFSDKVLFCAVMKTNN